MKKILGIVIVSVFFACQSPEIDNNIELTEFTKELIYLYIINEQTINEINSGDEIIIVLSTDDTCYYLSIFANDPRSFDYCREDYIGQTIYLGHAVRVFGVANPSFFRLIKKIRKQGACRNNNHEWFYDPDVWYICLYKNGYLCTRETSKVAPDEDISDIQSLVEKHFRVSRAQ